MKRILVALAMLLALTTGASVAQNNAPSPASSAIGASDDSLAPATPTPTATSTSAATPAAALTASRLFASVMASGPSQYHTMCAIGA
jgi:hypothetical protein